jgi:heme-degrading monooxygenase HmoA
VSYWRDEDSIRRWKRNADHLIAQQLGKEKWYPAYSIKVARVERAYGQGD